VNFPMMMSKGRILIWRAAFVLLLADTAHAAEFSGRVVSILDSDTIQVLHSQQPERIRLSGIDCPEKGQAYGKQAKQAVSALTSGKEVYKFGRTLADVWLRDGTNVNRTLVKEGCWWWYRKYAPGDTMDAAPPTPRHRAINIVASWPRRLWLRQGSVTERVPSP
jgi:micrococcal nuclease